MDNPSADTSSFESEIDRFGCIGNSRVTNENLPAPKTKSLSKSPDRLRDYFSMRLNLLHLVAFNLNGWADGEFLGLSLHGIAIQAVFHIGIQV